MNPARHSGGRRAELPAPDFRVLFDALPGLYLILLPDEPTFTIVAVNRAYAQATRANPHEIVGRGLFEVFPDNPEDAAATGVRNLAGSLHRVLTTKAADSMPAQKYDVRRPRTDGGGFEERYWSPVNSPLLGENGEVQFIIHRVEDVTEFVRMKRMEAEQGKVTDELRLHADQVEAELFLRSRQLAESQRLIHEREAVEERLRASEARFSAAFAEAPIGMVLTTPDGRILETNQAYLDMLGYSREALALRDSAHFTHPDDIAPTRRFYASLREPFRTSASIEKRYLRKDGKCVWARVTATMRRDVQDEPEQLIAIIEDITERKRAEERLRESQEQLRAIFDGTYEYIGLVSPDGTVLDCNRAALEFAHNTREEVIGLPLWETPWFALTPGASEVVRQGVALAASGEFVRYEAALRRPSGALVTFDLSLHPVRNERGEVVFLVPEGRDISERKAAELRDAFLVGLDDATRPLADAQEIVQTAARLLAEHLQVSRCAYADVESDLDTFNLTGDYTRDVPSIVGQYSFAQFGSECLRLMRQGKTYVVDDTATDDRVAEAIGSYGRMRIQSMIWVPLLKAGRLVAALAVHHSTPREWQKSEIELVQLVASRCWESIERVHVARELREREQRYRFLAESIPQMVWTATPDGMLDYVNRQGTTYFGVPHEELLGAGWITRVHPDEQEQVAERWKQSLTTGEPYEITFRLRRGSDGVWRWHLVRALALMDQRRRVVQWFGTCTDIEDQRQADANLRQQWQTFDTALSHTPDFTYTFDLDGRFTYVNRALLSLWQKPLEEARGKNFLELGYPAELAARLQRQIQEVIDTKRPVRDQTPFTGPTGVTGHYDYIFVPVLDARGRVKAVAGSTRDITEQNRAAEQIEDDRRRWRELLSQTPAAIAILRGPDHRFEWVNPDYIRLVSRQADDLVGKTVLEAVPEADGQIYIPLLDHVYRTGEPFIGLESLLRLDPGNGILQDRYVNFMYAATRDVAGEIDGVFAHVTDVTGMVLARKHLEESERQFRTLAETIPHLAWMADESGNCFWYNRRWYVYTGTTFDQVKGWGWARVHDPAVLPEVVKRWRSALSCGEPFEMVYPLKGANGSFRSFLTRIEPVKDSHGRVARWFGTNTDITDQRRTEEELRRTNRELEEFAYVASHDLQEPLRMVNIYTQQILRSIGDGNEKLSQYSGFVRQGVTRMEALIHDLLTFSRTVHQEEAPIGTANLAESFAEALSVLKERIVEAGAVIRAESLPSVRGDSGQMAHVFQNILSNALKYRNQGIPLEIRVSAKREGDQWIISVSDNGIGFEPRYSERIFGLFKRLHKDEYPGTGLGLAICKRIVERYGGRIWAEGRLGEGATFHFALPRAVEP